MRPCEVSSKEGYNFSEDDYTDMLKLLPPIPTIFTFLPASESIIKYMFTQSFFITTMITYNNNKNNLLNNHIGTSA